MRILLLGINYAPEIISTAVYSTGLAEEMSRRGAKVEVVTALPYYPAWRVFEGWRGPFWRREKSAEGVRIVHCPLYVPRNPTGMRRILHHASFALTTLPVAVWKGVFGRPDIVFVVAPSILSGPVGWLAARLGGGKAWLHIQDYEVAAAFATGLLREGSLVGRFAMAFENWVLRRFDRLSSISEPMLARLTKKGIVPSRIFELRNWADLGRIVPLSGPSPLKAELGINARHIALYSGNLANKQGLDILPDMARRLAHRKDLAFVICGDGPMRSRLVEMSAGLDNIHFLPLQPLERLSDLLGMADVHLLPQVADAADLVLPSKLTNMLASGRPVVATAMPDTALGREVDGTGLVVPPGDGAAAAEAVARLLDDDSLRQRLGEEARRRALERWDMKAIIDRLEAELRKLSGKPV